MKRLLSAAIAASTAAGWAWAEDGAHHSWLAPLKDIRLIEDRDDIHLSFGGKLRERVNVFRNDRFGLTAAEDDGYILLHRLFLNADLRMGQHVRAFVELGNHLTTSNDYNPGPFDEDSADFHQAFLDFMYDDTRLRLGRQEMPLNSARLMGTRDGPNVRLAYDGVRLDTTIGNVDLRLFAFNPVNVDEDAFNNRNNDDEALWGINTSYDFGASNANFYYIGLDRNDSRFNQSTADETRHSIGTRFFGTQGRWDWNTELVYQFGDFGSADIRAWTIASDTGYTFEDAAGSPRISMSANIASGDDDPNDNDLNTFNPLQPNLAYFEEAAVLAPQNFYNIEP
ncbi:MAG: alginate export family protein, partial [Pseudomonadota bacterium]